MTFPFKEEYVKKYAMAYMEKQNYMEVTSISLMQVVIVAIV